MKVCVVGAAGGIGQPLALLLKLSPLVDELSLYDVVPFVPGVGVDLSHCSSKASVKAFHSQPQMAAALEGCNLVVIPAGVPRKPGMTRDDLFNINAGIVRGICETIAQVCPKTWIAIITNPVNSTVPIAAEVLQRRGCYDPRRLFGVTTLDVVRARTFIAEILHEDPKDVSVPVIGGHAGVTILPLLSCSRPPVLHKLSAQQAADLTTRIQNAGTEVVEAKAGAGSATLSMAYAAFCFAESCMNAMQGQRVVECAYVASKLTSVPFFASPVRLGSSGIEEYLPLPPMNATEQEGLRKLLPELQSSVDVGVKFGQQAK